MHGAWVTNAIAIASGSLQTSSAFCSACTASHKSAPRGAHAPAQGTSKQCGIPRGTPLYPVPTMRPCPSTSTQPTNNFVQVARRLSTWATCSIVVARLGLIDFAKQQCGNACFWTSPALRFYCVYGVTTFCNAFNFGHVSALYERPAGFSGDTHHV